MDQYTKFVQSQELSKSNLISGESFILVFRDLQALIQFTVNEQDIYDALQLDARVIGYDVYEDRFLMLVHFCTLQQIPQPNPHIPSFYRDVKQFKLGFSREVTYMKAQCIITYDPLHLITADNSIFTSHSPIFAQNIKGLQSQSDLYTIAGADRRVAQLSGSFNKPVKPRKTTTTRKNSKSSQQVNLTQIEDQSSDDFQELPAAIIQPPMLQEPPTVQLSTKRKGFSAFFK